MPWTSDFRAGTIGVDPGGGSSVKYIRAITAASGRAEEDIMQEIASGSVFPDTVTRARANPAVSFTTEDIVGALDATGLWGTCLTASGADTGLEVFGQKQDCGGIASSGHIKFQILLGLLVPRTLNVDHQGNATMTFDGYARWDGTNDPITRTASVSLPIVTSTPVGRWTMEGMTVATQTITGKRSISIDFNPTVVRESADSDVHAGVVSLTSFAPRVTIRGVDPGYLSQIGLAGATCTAANTIMELRKRGVARVTAEHVKLTFAGIATVETFFDKSTGAPAQSAIVINCGKDSAGNAPITHQINVAL